MFFSHLRQGRDSLTPQVHKYRSAVGRRIAWRLAPLAAVAAIGLALDSLGPYGWAPLAGLAALGAWFVAGTAYRIEGDVLEVRQIPRRRTIRLSAITTVRRRSSAPVFRVPWSDDFALGTSVLEVEVSGWTTLVSPRDEEDFAAALGFPLRVSGPCRTRGPGG